MRAKKGSVLCVDDEPNILRSLHWMLHREFDVMTAPDGVTALDLLRKHDFDVIVSDQRMPGMIGSEFLRQACQVAPRAMRILLTGYSDMQAILKSINEGEVFRFINKPWSNEELTRTVEEAAVIAKTQPVPALAAPAVADATGERILLLDDDASMVDLLNEALPPRSKVIHALTLPEAVAAIGSEPIGVLVCDTRVARMDTTPLLKVLKQSHPQIVSVVLTVDSDVDSVVKLINQGQVYRFMSKPVKAGFLKILLSSAVQKHHELEQNPGTAQRHAVEKLPESLRDALARTITQEAARMPQATRAGGGSFLDRLGGGLKRLFS